MPTVLLSRQLFSPLRFLPALLAGVSLALWPLPTLVAGGALIGLGMALFYPRAAVLVIAALLPWQIGLGGGSGFDIAFGRLLIPLIFIGWLITSPTGFRRLPTSPAALAFYVFLALAAFSAAYAIVPEFALRKTLVFITLLPIFPVIYDYAREERFRQRLMAVLFMTASAAAALGIVQFLLQFSWGLKTLEEFWRSSMAPLFLGGSTSQLVLGNPSWFVNIGGATLMRAIATFPDPHIFAFLLGMSLPLGLPLLVRPWSKPAVLLGGGLIVMALLLTFSRGGYLGWLASITVMAIIYLRRSASVKKILGLALMGTATVFILISLPLAGERITSTFSGREGSALGRLAVWQDAEAAFLAHPFFGTGLGNYPATVDPLIDFRNPITSHSVYLDIAVELGLVGLTAWLATLGLTARQLVRGLLSRRSGRPVFLTQLSLLGGLTYFAVHALVETPLFSPRILPLFLILLALAAVDFRTADAGGLSPKNCG